MTAVTALIGFTAWTLLLVFVAVNWRFFEVLRGVPANSWGRGNEREAPALVKRMQHAHLNCLENLPVFAAIVLSAVALDRTAVVDPLACYVLYARLAQSIVHLIGTSATLVFIRAIFYVIQVVLFFYMMWGLVA